MTLLQFRPVDGRLDEILSMLMHSREVASHPSLSYAIRLVSEEIIVNIIQLRLSAAGRRLSDSVLMG